MIDKKTLEQKYLHEKKSIIKTARELGIPFSRVYYAMNKYGILRRSHSEASKIAGNKPPIRFIEADTSPSKDLAYILGVLKGDGCAHIRKSGQSGVVQLTQIRREFANSFETALRNIGLNSHTFLRKDQFVKQGVIYVTYANSFKFALWYKQLSFEDIHKILDGDPEFIKAFIRGFFESEGTNSISKRLDRFKWQIGIAGREGELYNFVEKLLHKMGFNFKRYCYNQGGKDLHILKSCDQHQNQRFIKETAPCIKNQSIEPTSEPRIRWCREKVIEELRNFAHTHSYSPSGRKVPPRLRGACERWFEKWNQAKEAANLLTYPIGYNLDPKTGRNSWETRRLKA